MFLTYSCHSPSQNPDVFEHLCANFEVFLNHTDDKFPV